MCLSYASDRAPSHLLYTSVIVQYSAGTPISVNRPKAAGGPVTQFAVFPSLPSGLRLNPVTGEITGTPSKQTDQAKYQVWVRSIMVL
jgi:hypothetical protein